MPGPDAPAAPVTGLAARLSRRGVYYGFAMVAVTLLVLVMSAGFRSAPSVMIVPLQDQFGWSRATISSAVSINLVCFGLAAPFAAALHERFGIRRVVIAALAIVAIASLATTRISQPWQLQLLWGVVIGSATGAVSVPLAAMVAQRWFVRRRGLVTGIMTAANATGQLVFLPALALLVRQYGWKAASICVAVVAVLLVMPLAALVMRNRPADVGLPPYGADELEEPVPVQAPVRNALGGLALGARSGTFWLLAFTFFVCGASTNGLIGTHLIPAAVDQGVPAVTAAGYLALIGVFDIVGTTLSGWLTDRYDPRTPAVLVLRAARHLAPASCTRCSARRTPGSSCSSCSTGSTGSRPCLRPSRSAPTASVASVRASCSHGSSRFISWARPRLRTGRASCGPMPAATTGRSSGRGRSASEPRWPRLGSGACAGSRESRFRPRRLGGSLQGRCRH